MRKISNIEKGLNKVNEDTGSDPQVIKQFSDEPLDQVLKECLVDVLRHSEGSELITDHKEVSVSHTTHSEPLMTFERFMEQQHN